MHYMEVRKLNIKGEDKIIFINFKRDFPPVFVLDGNKYLLEGYENYEATYTLEGGKE